MTTDATRHRISEIASHETNHNYLILQYFSINFLNNIPKMCFYNI